MTNKDLTIALKVKAELKQALTETAKLASNVDQLGDTAKKTAADMGSVASAVTQVTNDLQKAQQQTNAAAATYEYAGKSTFSMRDGMTSLSAAIAQVNSTMQSTARQNQTVAQSFVYAGQSSFSFRDAMRGTAAQAKISADTVARLLSTYDSSATAAVKYANDQKLLESAHRQGKISAEQYERALKNLQQASGRVGRSPGLNSANVGYQVQDIAVQAQMGTSPITIATQQLPQLIGSMSPLTGAVLAVAGAVAGAFIPSLFDAGEASDELRVKIEDLHEGYVNVTDAQRQFLRDQEGKKKSAILKDIEEQEEAIKRLTNIYEGLKASQDNAMGPRPGTFIGMSATGAGINASDEEVAKASQKITEARAKLDTKNQELAESEKELQRINGATIEDEKELAKLANQTVKRLKEETESYKLTGKALGEYTADKLKAQGKLRQEIIDLYTKQEAQKKATEAEKEAEAVEKRRASQAETTAKNNEKLVKGLEAKANALRESVAATAEAEFKERGLTGALLERARAASILLNAEKERVALSELQEKLLRSQQGDSVPEFEQFRNQYKKLLDQLEGDSQVEGEKIVKKLFDLATTKSQLNEIEKSFSDVLNNISRAENSIDIQRDAGLISEYEARQKIYELHQQQSKKLEEIKPLLEALQNAPGDVGRAAREALAALNEEMLRLQSTMTLLQSTLRDGLESGLTNAIMGLAQGTMTLRDAIREVAISVADALAQMAAQALAQKAVNALFGGEKSSGEEMKEAARDMNASAAAWAFTAQQIKAAAASLAASNASSGGSGGAGASGGSGWWGMAANAISNYFSGSYSSGGYTGPGGKFEPAGVVHKGEGVLSQTDIAALGGPAGFFALRNSLRNGYSNGGLAGYPAPAMPSPSLGNAAAKAPAPAFNASIPLTLNANLIDDPQRMAESLLTPQGEQALTILISRNPQEFSALLGSR